MNITKHNTKKVKTKYKMLETHYRVINQCYDTVAVMQYNNSVLLWHEKVKSLPLVLALTNCHGRVTSLWSLWLPN